MAVIPAALWAQGDLLKDVPVPLWVILPLQTIQNTVLILPLMWRGWVLNRWEGALLLAGYVAYLYSVVS